jgi:hypothetical protein
MRNRCKSLLGLWVLGMCLGVSNPAQADSVGPYYATPSWDQTLSAATRFIILSNFANEAVLDRETGLVWETSPITTTNDWQSALFQCTSRTTGGRKGWRLPSVHELASLVDPAVAFPGPTLPPGHPFTNVQSANYWSATTNAQSPDSAWVVNFFSGGVSNAGS